LVENGVFAGATKYLDRVIGLVIVRDIKTNTPVMGDVLN